MKENGNKVSQLKDYEFFESQTTSKNYFVTFVDIVAGMSTEESTPNLKFATVRANLTRQWTL